MRFVECQTVSGDCPIRQFISHLHAEEIATWVVRSKVILDRLPKQRLPAGWVDSLETFAPLLEFRFEGRDKPIRIIWAYGTDRGDILLPDDFYKSDGKQEQREYRRIHALYEDWERRRPAKDKHGKGRQGGKR
jgi:hypothetical protein